MAIRRHKVGCLEDVIALRVVEICTLYQGLGLEQLSDRRGASVAIHSTHFFKWMEWMEMEVCASISIHSICLM